MQLIFVVAVFVWFVLKTMDYFFYGQHSTQAAVWLVLIALNSDFFQGRTNQQKDKKNVEFGTNRFKLQRGLSCNQGVCPCQSTEIVKL